MTLISEHGLYSNVVSAPLIAIFSLLLMSGIWGLGSRVISFVTEEIYRDKIWLKMQAPVVSATFVAVISLTLSIFGLFYRDIAKCLAYSSVLIGIVFIIRLATRNPFNSGKTFDAWLYRVDRSSLVRNAL